MPITMKNSENHQKCEEGSRPLFCSAYVASRKIIWTKNIASLVFYLQ
jgi:hypothetical protein